MVELKNAQGASKARAALNLYIILGSELLLDANSTEHTQQKDLLLHETIDPRIGSNHYILCRCCRDQTVLGRWLTCRRPTPVPN